MIDGMLKAFITLMFGWTLSGVAAGMYEAYQRDAALIWCEPGEILVTSWGLDNSGRAVPQSRKCMRQPANVVHWVDGADGRPRPAQ